MAHRFSDLYTAYATEQTDAPPIFHRFLSYMVVSSVVNKNAWFPFGIRKLFPNLYLLIVAPSSAHRKSWSINIAIRMIECVHPEFRLPETSSRESFIAELTDEARQPVGCGLVHIDEFKGFMDRCKKKAYMEGFLQDLSSIYEGVAINRRKGVEDPERYKLKEPFVNIAAACSNDWLYQAIESRDISGGFLARFVWVVHEDPIESPKANPEAPNSEIHDMLVGKLIRISQFIGEVRFDEAGATAHSQWFTRFYQTHQGGLWDANYHRADSIIKKLALLNALMRVEASGADMVNAAIQITRPDVSQAILMIEDTMLSLKNINVGENPVDVTSKKVLSFISKNGPQTRSNLLQNVRGLNADILAKVLENLNQADAIHIETTPNVAGRPTSIITTSENFQKFLSK